MPSAVSVSAALRQVNHQNAALLFIAQPPLKEMKVFLMAFHTKSAGQRHGCLCEPVFCMQKREIKFSSS